MATIITGIDRLELGPNALEELVAYIPDGATIEQLKRLLEMKAELEELGCRVDITVRRLRYIHELKAPEGFEYVDPDLYPGYVPPKCCKCKGVALFGRSLPNPNPATTAMEFECFNGHRWTEETLWD